MLEPQPVGAAVFDHRYLAGLVGLGTVIAPQVQKLPADRSQVPVMVFSELLTVPAPLPPASSVTSCGELSGTVCSYAKSITTTSPHRHQWLRTLKIDVQV